jgi:methylmalonyl-CoA mutase
VAVVCGSDGGYAAEGVTVVAALRAEGVSRIHLVSRAAALDGDLVTALVEAGVDEFVHAGSDVIDLMGRTLDALGVDTLADVEEELA